MGVRIGRSAILLGVVSLGAGIGILYYRGNAEARLAGAFDHILASKSEGDIATNINLLQQGGRAAQELLTKKAGSPNSDEAWTATVLLSKMRTGNPAITLLSIVKQSPFVVVRIRAMKGLVELGAKEASPTIERIVMQEYSGEQRFAMRALAALDGSRACAVITRRICENDGDWREIAIACRTEGTRLVGQLKCDVPREAILELKKMVADQISVSPFKEDLQKLLEVIESVLLRADGP